MRNRVGKMGRREEKRITPGKKRRQGSVKRRGSSRSSRRAAI